MCSSFLTVSVKTMWSLIYTSSSSSPNSLCWWLVDGCRTPMDVFYHRRKVTMFLCIIRNMDLETLRTFGFLNQIWWDTRIELFKKNRTKLNGIPSCVSCLSLHPIYSFDLYLLPLHPLTKRKGDLLFFYQEFLQFHMLLLLHL